MYHYKVVKEKAVQRDIGDYTTYGIVVFSQGNPVHIQHDVAVKRAEAKAVAARCAAEQPSPKDMINAVGRFLDEMG